MRCRYLGMAPPPEVAAAEKAGLTWSENESAFVSYDGILYDYDEKNQGFVRRSDFEGMAPPPESLIPSLNRADPSTWGYHGYLSTPPPPEASVTKSDFEGMAPPPESLIPSLDRADPSTWGHIYSPETPESVYGYDVVAAERLGLTWSENESAFVSHDGILYDYDERNQDFIQRPESISTPESLALEIAQPATTVIASEIVHPAKEIVHPSASRRQPSLGILLLLAGVATYFLMRKQKS